MTGRTVALVPARQGSVRLEQKNRQRVGGRTLLERTAGHIGACGELFSDAVLSSNDPQLLDEAAGLGLAALARPEELCTPDAPAVGYVLDTIDRLRLGADDLVVILQVTSPFRAPQHIVGCIELLRADGAWTSAATVSRMPHDMHPLKAKVLEDSGMLRPFVEEESGRYSADLLPPVYARTAAVYATRVRTVLDHGDILGPACAGLVVPREFAADINDPLDLMVANLLSTEVDGLE